MSKERIRGSEGFTLIEVLVTIFVLSAFFALFAATLTTTSLTAEARDQDIALKVANNEVEGLRSLGYANLPASGSFSDPLLSALPSGSASTSISSFNAQTKKVIVSVGWQARNGGTQIVSLTTLVTQYGGL